MFSNRRFVANATNIVDTALQKFENRPIPRRLGWGFPLATRTQRLLANLSPNYPTGHRVARIRILSGHPNSKTTTWDGGNSGQGYTVEDVYEWISDLGVTHLQRSPCSGYLDANSQVPTKNGTTSVLNFLQGCLDAMPRVDSTSMAQRLSGNELHQGTFQSTAQSIFDTQMQLNPPQYLISIDNTEPFSKADIDSIVSILQEIGFKGYSIDACSSNPESEKLMTFSMICVNTMTWKYNTNVQARVKAVNPSLTSFQGNIDIPGPMNMIKRIGAREGWSNVAEIFQGLFDQDMTTGIDFMALIYQWDNIASGNFQWDAHLYTCRSAGPYWRSGDTIYTALKNMLSAYKPLWFNPTIVRLLY